MDCPTTPTTIANANAFRSKNDNIRFTLNLKPYTTYSPPSLYILLLLIEPANHLHLPNILH